MSITITGDRRTDLLNGIITFPQQIKEILETNEEVNNLIDDFWDRIVHNFMLEKPTSTIDWLNQFPNEEIFNNLLYHLCKSGWIESSVEMNYAFVKLRTKKLNKWLSDEEITNMIYMHKFLHYKLDYKPSNISDLVKVNNRLEKTGIVREGFMKASNLAFYYDIDKLEEYSDEIANDIYKGMSDITKKEITYQEVVDALIGYKSAGKEKMSLNKNYSDSRGRAIFQCTKKVLNPISHKPARALLTTPFSEPLNFEGLEALELFVAELLGQRFSSLKDKAEFGRESLNSAYLPEDLELEERIWLERIYEAYPNRNKEWNIPIECDAQCSMLEMIGSLLNCHKYLYGTNLAKNNDKLEDLWTIEGLPRVYVKKAMTPILYGSSASPIELWDKHKFEYDFNMVKIIMKEMNEGRFKEAIEFKDFVIGTVKPQAQMNVNINNEHFTINCNKFKWEETDTKEYFVYSEGQLKRVVREVHQVPDLPSFKRYFLTLLCHNLDSQVANKIALLDNTWILPNHDAFIVHPNDALKVRIKYKEEMTKIYKNRHSILKNYFKSIGIKEEYNDIDNEELEFSINALK